MATKLLPILSQFLNPAGSGKAKKTTKGADDGNQAAGEFATVLEGEYLDFVLFEIEPIQESQQ